MPTDRDVGGTVSQSKGKPWAPGALHSSPTLGRRSRALGPSLLGQLGLPGSSWAAGSFRWGQEPWPVAAAPTEWTQTSAVRVLVAWWC